MTHYVRACGCGFVLDPFTGLLCHVVLCLHAHTQWEEDCVVEEKK